MSLCVAVNIAFLCLASFDFEIHCCINFNIIGVGRRGIIGSIYKEFMLFGTLINHI